MMRRQIKGLNADKFGERALFSDLEDDPPAAQQADSRDSQGDGEFEDDDEPG